VILVVRSDGEVQISGTTVSDAGASSATHIRDSAEREAQWRRLKVKQESMMR